MCSQDPGSFTRIIAAMVIPRKTSSETTRPARGCSTTAGVLCAAMVAAVAMRSSSAGGDSTAARNLPQYRGGMPIAPRNNRGRERIPATIVLRGKKPALARYGLRV